MGVGGLAVADEKRRGKGLLLAADCRLVAENDRTPCRLHVSGWPAQADSVKVKASTERVLAWPEKDRMVILTVEILSTAGCQSKLFITPDFDELGGFLKNHRQHRNRWIRSNGSCEQDGDSTADGGEGSDKKKNADKAIVMMPPPAQPSKAVVGGRSESGSGRLAADNSDSGSRYAAPAAWNCYICNAVAVAWYPIPGVGVEGGDDASDCSV
ncbi:hypothetical protein ACLOJK_030759 [Asimina triloba]